MLELLFAICMLWVFGKMLVWGIKAAWGITKILFTIIFLPAILVGLVLGGLLYIAFPVLIIIGVVSALVKK